MTARSNLSLRIVLALLTLGGNGLYLITNRLLSGGIAPKLPVDDLIPLWPVWTIPYLLIIPLWIAFLVWSVLGMDDARFRRLISAGLITEYVSIAVFVLYPTYIIRQEVTTVGDPLGLIRYLYSIDETYNALPSMHMSLTVLLVLHFWNWQPRLRPLLAALVPVVILSTLFTRQHYVLDLVAGAALAVGATVISHYMAARWEIRGVQRETAFAPGPD
jgi:membrane-associated phospholipid phosphatase